MTYQEVQEIIKENLLPLGYLPSEYEQNVFYNHHEPRKLIISTVNIKMNLSGTKVRVIQHNGRANVLDSLTLGEIKAIADIMEKVRGNNYDQEKIY